MLRMIMIISQVMIISHSQIVQILKKKILLSFLSIYFYQYQVVYYYFPQYPSWYKVQSNLSSILNK